MTTYTREGFVKEFGITPDGVFDCQDLFMKSPELQVQFFKHPTRCIVAPHFTRWIVPGVDYKQYVLLKVQWWMKEGNMQASIRSITIYLSYSEFMEQSKNNSNLKFEILDAPHEQRRFDKTGQASAPERS